MNSETLNLMSCCYCNKYNISYKYKNDCSVFTPHMIEDKQQRYTTVKKINRYYRRMVIQFFNPGLRPEIMERGKGFPLAFESQDSLYYVFDLYMLSNDELMDIKKALLTYYDNNAAHLNEAIDEILNQIPIATTVIENTTIKEKKLYYSVDGNVL